MTGVQTCALPISALAPQHLFLSIEQFYGLAKAHAQFSLRSGDSDKGPGAWALPWPDVHADRGTEDPLERLKRHLAQRAERVLVLAESDGRRESLHDFLSASGLSIPLVDNLQDFLDGTQSIALATSALQQGFEIGRAHV